MRLWVAYAAVLAGTLVLLFVFAHVVLEQSLRARDRDAVRTEAGELVADYRPGALDDVRKEVAEAEALPLALAPLVRLADSENRTLVVSEGRRRATEVLARGPLPPDGTWRILGDDEDAVEVLTLIMDDGRAIQVGMPTGRAETLERFRDTFAFVAVPLLFLALLGGALLTRRALAPLYRLTEAIVGVAQTGALSERVPLPDTGDELDALVDAYNQALDRIETLVRAMRGSLDAVAHDLRTPLTRLRTAAETALTRRDMDGTDDAGMAEALGVAVEEAANLQALLNELLDVAEAEAGTLRLHRQPLDLGNVVADAADLYALSAEEAGVTLSVDLGADLVVAGDPSRLRQALANLLDNAVKFTPAGGTVSVVARAEGGEAVVEVADTGPGIAPEHLPRIWDRLYRADPSRAERGMGLGLSLVRAIAEAHEGSASVQSEPGRGATFTLRLPLSGGRQAVEGAG